MPLSVRPLRAVSLSLAVGAAAFLCFAQVNATEPTSPNASPAPSSSTASNPGSPDGAVASSPPVDGSISPDNATNVTPTTHVRDPRPMPIDHLSVAADGRTVTVYWFGGVDTCYALASVDVTTGADGAPVITVYEGTRAELPPDTMCIEIAVLKSTVIVLDQPLFHDGSQSGS
jgi:hypothetical protein